MSDLTHDKLQAAARKANAEGKESPSDDELLASGGKVTAVQTYRLSNIRVRSGVCSTLLVRVWNAQSERVVVYLKLCWQEDAESREVSLLVELQEAESIVSGIEFLDKHRGAVLAGADTQTRVYYQSKSAFEIGFEVNDGGVTDYMQIEGGIVLLHSFDSVKTAIVSAIERGKELARRPGV